MPRLMKAILLIPLFSLISTAAIVRTQDGSLNRHCGHKKFNRSRLSSDQVLSVTSTSTTDLRARLKQFPTISRTHVAFIFANDLWVALRDGGVAVPLTDAPGMKTNAVFSPDGQTIAFNGNLEGNPDIYTVPIERGSPLRITHLPGGNLCQWTPEGKLLFYTNSLSFNWTAMQLFTVPATGGLPTRLRVPFGGEAAISPDGEWLAYTHNWPFYVMDHWKHYRGGMANDIWLFNFRTNQFRKITALGRD